jgi:PmbA protein
MNFEETAQNIIDLTLKAGASDCDVVLAKSHGKSISCRFQKIEDLDESNEKTIGIRALVDQRQAFVSSSDIETDNVDKLVTKCVEMAKLAPIDDTAVLGDSSLFEHDAPDLDLFEREEVNTETLIEAVKECEDAALSVKGITNSEGAGASSSKGEFFLATSNGFQGGYQSSSSSVSCSVLAGQGQDMERDYEYAVKRHISDLPSAKEIGLTAAEKTLKRLNAKKISSTKLPVVFDKRISNDLLGYLASSISGTSIARGTSFLKDSLGKQIFNKDVTIIDDPAINRGLGSKPFDGEGVKVEKRELVSNGKLNTWILNTSTAKKLGLKTTGNASRSVGSPPGVSTSNLYMTNGLKSYDDILSSINYGFYATELIGMGVNLVTGDYSMGASGMLIEKGEITHAVSEVTIASNLKEIFMNLSAANDLEFKYRTNAPTVLIESMTLAGK